jgi:hypothetical protein
VLTLESPIDFSRKRRITAETKVFAEIKILIEGAEGSARVWSTENTFLEPNRLANGRIEIYFAFHSIRTLVGTYLAALRSLGGTTLRCQSLSTPLQLLYLSLDQTELHGPQSRQNRDEGRARRGLLDARCVQKGIPTRQEVWTSGKQSDENFRHAENS